MSFNKSIVCSIPVLLLACFACSSPAQSAGNAVLEVPLSLHVRSIDGESVERMPGGGILRLTNRYEMEAGERKVKIRYREIWPDNPNDDHEVAKSKWRNIKIDARAGAVYRVTHPSFTSYQEARVFARDPELSIETVEESTVGVSPTPEPAPAAHPMEARVEPEPKIETAAVPEEEHAEMAPPVAIPAGGRDAPAAVAAEAMDSEVSPLELMQFWWKQASPAERKRFADWIAEQE